MKQLRRFSYGRVILSSVVLASLVLELFGVALFSRLFSVGVVDAAVVVIDDTVSTTATSNNHTGAQTVFVSDTTGYTFYRDANGSCSYGKTTDAGATWGASVTVDSQTDCVRIVVWYDQWTPGDAGSLIHIATMDTSADGLFYNALDTSNDSLLLGSSAVDATVSSGQVPTYSVAINTHAITKGTNGRIYLVGNDVSDAFVVSCTTSCGVGTNWTETGVSPLDNTNDHNLLLPLAGGNILLINRDISASNIRSKIWNGSAWSASWVNVDTGASNSSNYDGGMSATINLSNGHVYLAYATENNILTDNNDDLRTAIYDGTAWTTMTDVLTNVSGRGLLDVAIAVDQNNGNVYVAYAIQDTAGVAASANIYHKRSTDAMTSWGAETGPVNSTAGDIRKPALDPSNFNRLYVAWYEASVDDRFGETLADIGPDSILAAAGTQASVLRAGSMDNYLGGQFIITSLNSNSVSSVAISETGTIDGANGLANVQLFYDIDGTFPYNCASESYSGGETQFGTTITAGFDPSTSVATFTGSTVGVGPTQALCLYVVSDVTSAALDGATIDLAVSDPPNDIGITGSDIAPATTVTISGTTAIVSSQLTQTNYHWRNDDGSEAGATSATGGVENTDLPALAIGASTRLRIGVSVEGSTSTEAIAYQLQYAEAAPTCSAVSVWTAVDGVNDAFNIQSTVNLSDGADTTNIPISAGGVSDENAVFFASNGGVQDIGDITNPFVLATNQFTEFEFGLVASTSAVEGTTYCFRLSDSGANLGVYAAYARATINSEVSVETIGTQIATVDIPTSQAYVGGAFVIRENVGSRNVTAITITETGTIDAQTGLTNISLFYDVDTTAPYDCTSESYGGSEPAFGGPDTDGMSGPNGSSTFSGSVGITTTQSMCVYVVTDVTTSAQNTDTIGFTIESARNDVTVTGGGSISPSNPLPLDGVTAVRGAVIDQTNYHWRNSVGTEAGGTSATAGNANTPLADFQVDTPIRLRLQLSNQGATSSPATAYRLEFAKRITTCDAIASWTAVDATDTDDWDMFDAANLTHGDDTTNIAVSSGGVIDANTTFVTPNAGVRELSGTTISVSLRESEFIEYEFSLTATLATAFATDYCFRLSDQGFELPIYTVYPELTTAAKRDFRIQQGTTIVTGLNTSITAGVDYTAPASTSRAFIRITNTNNTGAGDIVGGGSQDVEETTVYIQNPSNLASSITFSRDRALNESYVNWEIVEFIAQPGTDNELFVRAVDTVSMNNGQTTMSGAAVTGVTGTDVVVFVTGVSGDDISDDFYATQVTAAWDSITNIPTFTRGDTGNSAVNISYAVVEFTGINWNVQRVEHTYSAAGVIETQTIVPVASLNQTFIHTQKRLGPQVQVASLGHEVYLSSIGVVSFILNTGADMLVPHTSVAWVVENQQTGVGAMQVERQSGTTLGGAEPATLSITLADTLDAVSNTSIFGNSAADGTNIAHPRAIAGLRVVSPTSYELWRSDTGSQLQYRTEIVQWPVADLAIGQNYYRFYTDNNQLTPTDPWPLGVEDLGENTSITDADDPPGLDEIIRVRTTLRAKNANWPADFYAFKMQYAERVGTCTAIGVWTDVGQAGSGEIWRGFAATGTVDGTDVSTDPPTPGDLLISVADVAGSLVHQNQSATNTYIAFDGEDVEYDWYLQHNGAAADTTYCFRVVQADGTELSGYLQYPQIRTADFTPEVVGWRWYDDVASETPTTPVATLNAAPTEITASTTLALRVVLDEQKNVPGADVKFKLQFSTDILFTNPIDVVASSSCTVANEWCYTDGGGVNNTLISTAVTGIADTCVASTGSGCGTHNSSADYVAGHEHGALAAQEYAFTIESRRLSPSAVYYFRLFDVASARPVGLFTAASHPAAVAESARLVFTINGLPAATTVAGVTTDVTTTATAIDFGRLPVGSQIIGAQQLSVNTNAIEGYQVWKVAAQPLTSSGGSIIDNISTSNATPGSWTSACAALAAGCVGYHTTDATLAGGSARFAATDTYAALGTSLEEIMFSSIAINESHEVVYQIAVSESQLPGDYTTSITYIATPVF